jgi:hypothetical protein
MLKKQCVFSKNLFLILMLSIPGISIAYQNTILNCQQMQISNDSNIKDCFIGTWKLVSNMKKDGDVITYPYGKDAVGYITYDANGYMSVQMMQQNRTTPVPGYFAYFGRYEIDKKTNVIHHYLTGSLTPSDVGTDRQRSYQFIGDQLHLIPVEETNREVVWEKIK